MINRTLRWLKAKLSSQSDGDEIDKPSPPPIAGTERAEQPDAEYTLESTYAGEFDRHVRDIKQGIGFPMPDIYATGDTVTQPQLEPVEEEPLEAAESMGFDPYNTGRLDTSNAWNSQSRDSLPPKLD
jgi:hypothetical protein